MLSWHSNLILKTNRSKTFYTNHLVQSNVGNGYITTGTLKEILREIDSTLNEYNLDQIVDEVDEDGSGTIDFDEFMAMMTGE